MSPRASFAALAAALSMGQATADGSFRVGTGSVSIDFGVANPEQELGFFFVRNVTSQVTRCYVGSLIGSPAQSGEIAFSLEPPAGDGPYRVTLDSGGTLEPETVACMRRFLEGYYHYADKAPLKTVDAKGRFSPRIALAPEPPNEKLVRALAAQGYRGGIVKIVDFRLRTSDFDFSPPDILRRFTYDIDLEFVADGEETTCVHGQTYKVFTQGHYENKFDGHSCESRRRKRGERTTDRGHVEFHLPYEPEMARGWMTGYEDRYYCGSGPCPARRSRQDIPKK